MKTYVLGLAAERDLDSIWEYIANDNPEAADRWILKLLNAFETLASNPGIGHRREDLTSLPILFWPVGAYLVLYRSRSDIVEIVAVTQGARDIPAFLSEYPR